jgi:hypothetical protein
MKAFYATLIVLSQIGFSTIVISANAQGFGDKRLETLCVAVSAGDLTGVNTALKQGASAKGFCEYGSAKFPLQVILMAPKNADIIHALVKAGADINVEGVDTILVKALKVDPQLGVTPTRSRLRWRSYSSSAVRTYREIYCAGPSRSARSALR